MRKLTAILKVVSIMGACKLALNHQDKTAKIPESKGLARSVSDTIPKVTGIGGVFFFSENPKAMREWYGPNLGHETDEYGSVF